MIVWIEKKKKGKKWTNIDLCRCVYLKKIRDVHIENLSLFFFLFTTHKYINIYVWILSSSCVCWFSWGLHTIIKKERESSVIFTISIYRFDLFWLRWQAHSMDNHRLEREKRNETRWPVAMSNSFDWENKSQKRKKNSSGSEGIRSGGIRTNERNLLASLFSPFFRWEREKRERAK